LALSKHYPTGPVLRTMIRHYTSDNGLEQPFGGNVTVRATRADNVVALTSTIENKELRCGLNRQTNRWHYITAANRNDLLFKSALSSFDKSIASTNAGCNFLQKIRKFAEFFRTTK